MQQDSIYCTYSLAVFAVKYGKEAERSRFYIWEATG